MHLEKIQYICKLSIDRLDSVMETATVALGGPMSEMKIFQTVFLRNETRHNLPRNFDRGTETIQATFGEGSDGRK